MKVTSFVSKRNNKIIKIVPCFLVRIQYEIFPRESYVYKLHNWTMQFNFVYFGVKDTNETMYFFIDNFLQKPGQPLML
jgi:hypothetical protein